MLESGDVALKFWTSPAAGWAGLTLAVVSIASVVAFVDLSPRVEGEFFFAEDDPQMQASEAVAARFSSGQQLILRVEDLNGDSGRYIETVGELSTALAAVAGVTGVFSVTTDSPSESPLFQRILLTPDPQATNVVLLVDETDPEVLLPRVEAVVEEFEGSGLEITISGVPAIVEMIRRSLYRDLVVFSGAAVVVFALLIGLVYRDAAIVLGTISTCLIAVSVTLLAVQALSIGIGLLTANLVTIVFVLTLSHVVFFTGNWRRAAGRTTGSEESGAIDRDGLLRRAFHDTAEGSFWSMMTTLLGFASLLVATAQPLRELGIAGSVGALTAILVAYLVYPAFLGRWARPSGPHEGPAGARPLSGSRFVLPGAAVVVMVMAVGVPRIDTDPSLLSYFDPGSDLSEGLVRVDADGGSSTLDIVVADPGGAQISDREVYPRLESLQEALEADSAVGVVLSPTVLIEHARTIPLAGLLPVGVLLDLASSDAVGRIGLGYVTPEREEARFSLRMRETVDEPRQQVMDRLRANVESAGIEPVVIAGLYDLQAQLGRLIESSLKIGIGGLLALFLVVAFVVSRSGPIALIMWACLATIPVVILGTFGHTRMAVDIITSPAANIALAIGADSMIHLVVRVRRLAAEGVGSPWAGAVSQVGGAVLGASATICAGFGIFALSSFPPTQRFGLAVIVGTVAAASVALLVLPRLACLPIGRAGSLSGLSDTPS